MKTLLQKGVVPFLKEHDIHHVALDQRVLATVDTPGHVFAISITEHRGIYRGMSICIHGVTLSFRPREESLRILQYVGHVAPGKWGLREDGQVSYVLDCVPLHECTPAQFKERLDVALQVVCSLYQPLVKCLVAGLPAQDAFASEKGKDKPQQWEVEVDEILRKARDNHGRKRRKKPKPEDEPSGDQESN